MIDGFVKNRTQSILVSLQESRCLSEHYCEGINSADGKTVAFEAKHSDLDYIRTIRLNTLAGSTGFLKYHVYYNSVDEGEEWIRILTRESSYEITNFRETHVHKQGGDEKEHRFNIPIHTNKIKLVLESPNDLTENTYTLSYKLLKWYEFSAYKGISYNSKKINPLGDLQYPKAAIGLPPITSLNNNMVCHNIDNYSEVIDLSNSGDDIVKSYFLLRERYTGLKGRADQDTGWMVIGMFRPTKYKEGSEIVMQQGYELNSEQDIPFLDNKPLKSFLCDYVLRDDENDLLYPVGRIEPVNKTYSHEEEITLSSGSKLHRLLQGVNDDMIIHYSDIVEKDDYIYVVGISKNDNMDEHQFAYVKKASYCVSARHVERLDTWYEGQNQKSNKLDWNEVNKHGIFMEIATEDGEIKYGHEYVNPVFLYKIDRNGNIIRKRELPYQRHWFQHERMAFGRTQQALIYTSQEKLILKTYVSNSAVGHYVFDRDLNLIHKSGTMVFPDAAENRCNIEFVATNINIDWFGGMEEIGYQDNVSADLFNTTPPVAGDGYPYPPPGHTYLYYIKSFRIRKNSGDFEDTVHSEVHYYKMADSPSATGIMQKLSKGYLKFNCYFKYLKGIIYDNDFDIVRYIFITSEHFTTRYIFEIRKRENIYDIPEMINYYIIANRRYLNEARKGYLSYNQYQKLMKNFIYKRLDMGESSMMDDVYAVRSDLFSWSSPDSNNPLEMASFNGSHNTPKPELYYLNIRQSGQEFIIESVSNNRKKFNKSVTCFGNLTDNIM